jgi:hypothetical protein
MLILSALFLYTLKIMRNINIQSGRGLILSGDRQRAGTYVGIAKRRMFEMKQVMRIGKLQYMKRVHYLDRDCVWVHLLSIGGSDFIRIHSCAEGGVGCSIGFVGDVLEGASPLETVFTFTAEGFEPKINDLVRSTLIISYGDGRKGQGGTGGANKLTHKYRESGVFDVSVKAWNTFKSQFVQTAIGLIATNVTSFERISDFHAWEGSLQPDRDQDEVNAEALADVNAKPFAEITVSDSVYAEQNIYVDEGPGWDDEGDLGSSGFRGFFYRQRYSVWEYEITDFFDVETFIAYILAGNRAAITTSTQRMAMGAEAYAARLDTPQDKLKILINTTPYLPLFENANSSFALAIEMTEQVRELRIAETPITITFTSFDDWATVSPTPIDRTPMALIAPEGWWSNRPNVVNVDYDCIATSSKSEYITAT